MEWRYLGALRDAKTSGCSGVYLIVHRGIFDRVVYVGVSNNIGRRITEHYEGYLRGNRTIYNAGIHDDVYTFMSTLGIYNHIKFYQKLAHNYNIWASTTIHFDTPRNLLAEKQEFSSKWQDILFNKYLPQLVVWGLPMLNYNYLDATKIESVIQSKLIKAFNLRGFFNVKNISILGKIEHPQLKRILPYINTLNLEPASKLIFDSLNLPEIPFEVGNIFSRQLEYEIVQRKNEKQKEILIQENKSSSYKNYGKVWTPEDQEKLRVMLVVFNMTPKEMSQYLLRQPSAIAKRISDNDKLSNKKWREHLKWL